MGENSDAREKKLVLPLEGNSRVHRPERQPAPTALQLPAATYLEQSLRAVQLEDVGSSPEPFQIDEPEHR